MSNRPDVPVSDPDSAAALRLRIAGGVSTAAWGLLAWRSHHAGMQLGWMLATMAAAWIAFAWALRRVTPNHSRTIILFAFAFRFLASFATPVMEDDHHRFLWDGYRFATTGNPYAEAPQERFADTSIPLEFRTVLDRVNHPDIPTVYGPLTQWAFRLSYAIAPARLWPWKLILLAAELAIFAMLWPALNARGRLLLAWCPLAVFETGFNAHPDVIAISLLVASCWLGSKSRPLAAGAAAGLAIAAKIFAAPLAPFVLWRLGLRAWAMAAAALLALYAPFWLRGHAAGLTGLRAMTDHWEFNSSLFAISRLLLPHEAAQAACILVFGILWLVLLVRWTTRSPSTSPDSPLVLPPGQWIYGAFLLLSATANPWYFLWLWPFVAMRISALGLCALAAVSLAYVTGLNLGSTSLGNFEHPAWLRPLEFGLIAFAAIVVWSKNKTRP